MLIVFFICDKLVPILRNGCGIWGKHYVTLFQENEMSAGLQSRNSKLDLQFFLPYLPSGRVLFTVFVLV